MADILRCSSPQCAGKSNIKYREKKGSVRAEFLLFGRIKNKKYRGYYEKEGKREKDDIRLRLLPVGGIAWVCKIIVFSRHLGMHTWEDNR